MGMSMEKAIKTAIEFETKVSGVYSEAAKRALDPVGKRVLEVLAFEEEGHLDYLKSRLMEWQNTQMITQKRLKTAVPSKDVIENAIKKLGAKARIHSSEKHHSAELRMLRNALEVEIETGDFYKKMVKELPDEGQKLFARFVEIEEGHRAIVQAEIDYISGPGYWFDFREFDLSGG